MALELIGLCEQGNSPELLQSYWNTYHCQSKVCTAGGRMYGRYCKNRCCTICCANRKADIINRYLPGIQGWPQPQFLTLTIKAVPFRNLNPAMKSMIKEFAKIVAKYRKQYLRGKGPRLMGIRSLECNYNPRKKTYNPHFHIIVPDKPTAELLKKEWLMRAKPGWV